MIIRIKKTLQPYTFYSLILSKYAMTLNPVGFFLFILGVKILLFNLLIGSKKKYILYKI